jgi:hypothetical protein
LKQLPSLAPALPADVPLEPTHPMEVLQ